MDVAMTDQASFRLPSGLHAHTGYWLDRLRGLVHGRFEAALAGHDVSVAQWSVLVSIFRDGATTPREVAQHMDTDPGAVTRLLDRLEAKGLLRRNPAPGDRRSLRLELTGRATALVPQLTALADANDAAFFGVLGEADQVSFRRLLAALLRAHGVEPSPSWEAGGPG
jgi:DNA-binding MarR family transcriptional regulator